MPTISWQQLIVLMCFGEPDTYAGVVHVRELEPEPRDFSRRVFRRGELLRREQLDGRPSMIVGENTRWAWLRRDVLPTAYPKGMSMWGSPDDAVVHRPALSRWEGTDFTRPTGPIRAGTFLGRPAWEVELAPPSHKPYPLTIIVDAETGVVLQQRNDGFGTVIEWAEISFDVDLPDDLFTWDGDTLQPREFREEHRREMAAREQWLRSQGITELSVRITPDVTLHEWDGTGAFQASFHGFVSGSVSRRPCSGEPWDTRTNYPHNVRWSDDHFDWHVGTDQELSPSQVADLRAQLTQSGSAPDR